MGSMTLEEVEKIESAGRPVSLYECPVGGETLVVEGGGGKVICPTHGICIDCG